MAFTLDKVVPWGFRNGKVNLSSGEITQSILTTCYRGNHRSFGELSRVGIAPAMQRHCYKIFVQELNIVKSMFTSTRDSVFPFPMLFFSGSDHYNGKLTSELQ